MSDEHGSNSAPENDANKRFEDDMDFSLEEVPSSEDAPQSDTPNTDSAAPDTIDDDIFPPQDAPIAQESPSHQSAERTDTFPESPDAPVDEQPAEIDNKSEYVQEVEVPEQPPAKFVDYLKSRELWLSIAAVAVVGFGLLYLFFNILLPSITRQTEIVSVPGVVNMNYAAAKSKLKNVGLKVVIDSQYNPDMPPQTVLLQEPKQLSRVKPGRRVYLIINKVQPPEVKLPDIQDVHIDQATYLLENWGLKVGKMTYKPGRAKDIVKKAYHKDERIQPGDPILVGEQVDLMISRGLGNRKVELADVRGMSLQEAVMTLKSYGLEHGQVRPIKADSLELGEVVRQYPKPTRVDSVLQGYQVDMWVNGTQSEIEELEEKAGIGQEDDAEAAIDSETELE